MGYGIGYGAGDGLGEYNHSAEADAYLMIKNVLGGADPAAEIAKSQYLTSALRHLDGFSDAHRERIVEAMQGARDFYKQDPTAMERLASIGFMTREELGLPTSPVAGERSTTALTGVSNEASVTK